MLRLHRRISGTVSFLVILAALSVWSAETARCDPKAPPQKSRLAALPAPAAKGDFSAEALQELARRDPARLLSLAEQHCRGAIQDYRCMFQRQERIDGELDGLQTIDVLYRSRPRSVYMKWVKNPDRIRRARWIQGVNQDDAGDEQVTVEPAGVIARLFVSQLDVEMKGEQAKKSSRHTMDQFGFHAVLSRINAANAKYAAQGTMTIKLLGEGAVDGRPTWIIRRDLPYEESPADYPDACLIICIDQGWLAPVAVYTYADEARKELLGSYVSTDVRLNVGLTDSDFQFSEDESLRVASAEE